MQRDAERGVQHTDQWAHDTVHVVNTACMTDATTTTPITLARKYRIAGRRTHGLMWLRAHARTRSDKWATVR